MKISKDRELNVGYIEFKKAKISKTIRFRKNFLIDLDGNGEVVGIEILDLLSAAPRLSSVKRQPRGRAKRA